MPFSPTLRVVEHHAYAFRPFWRSGLVSSLITPVFFLAAIGVGLGSLIDETKMAALGGSSYLAYVGTGLLAASAMQVATMESMFPIMAGIKWVKFWHAIVASPIGVAPLVAGQFVWTALRLAAGATSFLIALALFGVVDRPLAVLAIPAATLCGLAFATPIAAFSSTQQNDQWFTVILRVGITPLYLFSGTFFPIDQLPAGLRAIARFTPLWHGVELTRGAVLGGLGLGAASLHVAYLVTWVVVGWLAARVLFPKRMAP